MSATLLNDARVPHLTTFKDSPVRPELRELLTKSALAGVVALFVHAIIFSFVINNYSKLMMGGALHLFLLPGAVAGVVHGLLYWCYLRMFQNRFRVVARFLIALAVVASSYALLDFLYPSDGTTPVELPLMTLWAGLQVLGFSVMTGSRWRPWRALVYGVGSVNSHQRLPASVVGLVLRVALLFFCLQTIFVYICILQTNVDPRDYVISWFVVVDFVIGLIIALVNPRFWLALSLAIIINSPWIYLSLMYPDEASRSNMLLGGYLLLWCAYLVTRWRRLDPLFAYIREELRYYYLVD